MKSLDPTPASGRDHVATAIEMHLRSMGTLEQSEMKSGAASTVRVRFEGAEAIGENIDIALVRLAVKLLDDSRFQSSLRSALSEPMASMAKRQ